MSEMGLFMVEWDKRHPEGYRQWARLHPDEDWYEELLADEDWLRSIRTPAGEVTPTYI